MVDKRVIQGLDDATVLRIIGYITEQLKENAKNSIHGAEEAQLALAEMLSANGCEVSDVSQILSEKRALPGQAKALLELFWDDDEVRPMVEELLISPPAETQRSVELAIASAVILGGLITWLQTKVEIEVNRKRGKTDFRFHLLKEKTGDDLVRRVVKSVSQIVGIK